MQVLGLDHVQLAIPAGGEPRGRAFFVDLLGFEELVKPDRGVGRTGCWFRAGAVELHMGVDSEFRPASKAHPALVVDDLAALTDALERAGVEVRPGGELLGRTRVFADDPFGNRIEWIEHRGCRAPRAVECADAAPHRPDRRRSRRHRT